MTETVTTNQTNTPPRGLDRYIDRAKAAIMRGNREEIEGWRRGVECGCMGPQRGEDLCPCEMRVLAAEAVLATPLLTPAEFAEKMQKAAAMEPERGHVDMDELMAELLRSLGYGDGIDVFDNATRWYA